MKKLFILVVCQTGFLRSAILEDNVKKALEEFGVDAEVERQYTSGAISVCRIRNVDIIVATEDAFHEIKKKLEALGLTSVSLVGIKDVLNYDEIKQKLFDAIQAAK